MSPKTEPWGWEEYVLLVGIGAGLVAFLAIGVVPALVYGGYAALALFSEIIGGPVEPTFAASAFIVVGMVLGVVALGALFATGGLLLGLAAVGVAKTGELAVLALRRGERAPAGATGNAGR